MRHKDRHRHFKAGSNLGGLQYLARCVAFDCGLGPSDFAHNRGGQFNGDRFFVVKHHFKRHAVFKIIQCVAHIAGFDFILVEFAVHANIHGVCEIRIGTYSYFADPMYVCMDSEFNQYEVEASNMGDALNYLEDGMSLEVVFYDEKAISVELPTTVVREITWTELGPSDFAHNRGGQFNGDRFFVVKHHFKRHAVFKIIQCVAHIAGFDFILVEFAVHANIHGVCEIRIGTYSYFADPMYVCMDSEFNQYEVEASNMGDALNYLEDGMSLEVVFYDEKAISVELPTTVVREITWTEPAVKGDTSGKVLKPAKIATGFEVPVPIFVAQGDKVEIDTRTGEYRKRV